MHQNNDNNSSPLNPPDPEGYVPTSDEKAFINEYIAISKEGILIKKGSIAVRMFLISGGGTALAFTFSELVDSFIVGFPALINSSDSTVVAKMMSPVPMIRMYKHSIIVSGMPPPKYLLCYLMACKSQLHQMPGFFDETRTSQVDALIGALQEGLNITELKKSEVKTEPSIPKKSITPFEFPDYDHSITTKKPRLRH